MFKGAPKLYFAHFLCVTIIFYNTGLSKSTFSINYFGKLVFYLCFLAVLNFQFDATFIEFITFYNHCLYWCHLAICDFVLALKNYFFLLKQNCVIKIQF